jgi:hypothetical protein
VAVVALLQVHANFLGGLHLELIHSLTGLGHVDLIVALHIRFSPSVDFRKAEEAFRGKPTFLSATIALPKSGK